MNLEELHERAKQRIEGWGKTLRKAPGEVIESGILYHNYQIWISRGPGGKPVHLSAWGQWMAQRYQKTRHRGRVAYCDVAMTYDPFAPEGSPEALGR
jgi:hypothetical protein